jgi:hypothetical protein
MLRAGDSPAHQGIRTMSGASGATGFQARPAPAASSRLIDAVAASLAVGSLSLCLIVTLTVMATRVATAMPIPA